MKYVIIGGVAGGATAAARLRRIDEQAEIILLEKGKYILLSAHREENIDTEKNFMSLFSAINKMAEKYDMPILYSCHPRSRNRLTASGLNLTSGLFNTSLWVSMITIVFK
jgi:UDP-N-acetylglucosamine 2-epimerase